MLAKITKGQDFYGCLRYVLSKTGAERIGGNMEGIALSELVAEFNLSVQRQQRRSPRNLAQVVVCHTSLSVEIGRNLEAETWNAIAKDYLTEMGFNNNQFVMVRHTDTQHDHVHLVIARSRLDGTVVNGWLDYQRAQLVLRKLEQDYQLQSVPSSWETDITAPTVNEVRQFHQTGEPSVRVRLQVTIDDALSTSTDLDDFRQRLAAYGVESRLRQISTGIAGISYKLNDIAFPGYKLGKRYTWNRIQTQLGENYERRNETSCQIETGAAQPTERDSATPDLDRQSGTPPATRTEVKTHSDLGGSGEKSDSRRAATASIRESSVPNSEPARESISAHIQPSATERNNHTADESDSGGTSGESANVSANSQGTQSSNCHPSNREHRTQPRAFRDQNSKSAGDQAIGNSEPTAAETSQAAHRISESTSPAAPDQTRMGQNLRIPNDVRNFDGLHGRPDAAISATSNQSAASADAKQPTQISLKWQDYCDRVNESNPVKRDEKVVRLAISDGKQQKRSSKELWQAVNRLLQQSPYVQWMREIQGDEKTNAYTKLTIQAAYQPEGTSRRHEAQQRQRQKIRQRLR